MSNPVVPVRAGDTVVDMPQAAADAFGFPVATPQMPPIEQGPEEGGAGPRWEPDRGWVNPVSGGPAMGEPNQAPIVAQKFGPGGGLPTNIYGQETPADPELLSPPLLGEPDAPAMPWTAPALGQAEATQAEPGGPLPGGLQFAPLEALKPQTRGVPGEMPEDYLDPYQLGEKYSTLPLEEQEKKRFDLETARENFKTTALVDESVKQKQAAVDNARAYEERMRAAAARSAEIDADAKRLATTKIDPLGSIPLYRKIAGVLAAVVGGFAASSTGGRNVGLDVVTKMIDDEVATQTANLQNQRDLLGKRQTAVGEEYARSGDLFKAAETVRLATYDSFISKLEADAMKLDPRGTQAVRALDQINQLKMAREKQRQTDQVADEKRRQQEFENQIKAAELGVKVGELDVKRGTLAIAQKKAAGGGTGGTKPVKPDDVVREPSYFQGRYGKTPPEPMSENDFGQWVKTGKGVEEYGKAQRENSPEEQERQLAAGKIVDDQGNPVKFRNPEVASKMAKLSSSSDIAVQAIDRILQKREDVGWESDLVAGPALREMKSDFSKVLLELKNTEELGVLAGPDMGILHQYAGTKDPTEYRDPSAGLRRLRKNLIEKRNTVINNEAVLPEGQTVRRWDPPPPEKSAKTPGDEALARALAFDPEKADLESEFGIQDVAVKGSLRAREEAAAAMRANAGISPSVRESIDRLARTARNQKLPKAERERAEANLTKLANDAEWPSVRSYAAGVRFGYGAGSDE